MTPPLDPTALTALAEKLINVSRWLREDELPNEQADQCGPLAVSDLLAHTAATLRALASPATPVAEGQTDWQPIETAPEDGTLIIGALIRNGKVWRVHDMKHNGLAFYTVNGSSLPQMSHWLPLPGQGHAATPAGLTRRVEMVEMLDEVTGERVFRNVAPPAALDREALVKEIERLWREIPLHRQARLVADGNGIDPAIHMLRPAPTPEETGR